ncbi:MAG: LptA/OstA family protein [Puniceicoccaceae bacterium]
MTLIRKFYRAILPGLIVPFLLQPFLSAQEEGRVQNTIISSQHLEMQGTAEKNYFYFSGDVEVKGTNLQILCDELTVVALREGPSGATIGSIGAIEEINARGSVEIHQAGRSAYAGRAEVNPKAGTVVLSDSPRVVDDEVEVQGYQFVLHRGEKKFESVPDPNAPAEEPSRSVVRLGAMPDLGFDQEEDEITVDTDLAEPEQEAESVEGEADVTGP